MCRTRTTAHPTGDKTLHSSTKLFDALGQAVLGRTATEKQQIQTVELGALDLERCSGHRTLTAPIWRQPFQTSEVVDFELGVLHVAG